MTTREFLTYFPGFCVQLFDDSTEKRQSLARCGRPGTFTKEQIKTMNDAGAGVFFSINSFPDGDRKAVNCKKVNAWFVESDVLTIDEQYRNLLHSPISPSFIIRSEKSLHAYWLAKDGTIPNFRKVQKGLIHHFEGDEACKDISRVLRIPGFNHMKGKPFQVELVHVAPVYYTEAEMIAAFPEPIIEKPVYAKHNFTATGETVWEVLGNLNNKKMLECLSHSRLVKNESFTFQKRSPEGEYILVNEQMCDAWLDGQGMIGSGKRGGPTWIQWAEYYGNTKKEILDWAKEKIPEVQEWTREHEPTVKEIVRKQVEEIKKPTERTEKKKRYTWGTRTLDTSFAIIKPSSFIVVAAKSNSGKTTYTFDMATKNAELGHKVLYLSLEMDEQTIKEQFARNYSGITIEEELDYTIPEHKQKAFNRRMAEYEANTNLKIAGVRRATDVIWETIVEIINSYEEIDLVFIDNLDLIGAQPGEDDLQRQKRITKQIMNFTSERQIPIVLIHHYRKSMSGAKDNGMDEMAGSGKIKDGADYIVKVSRNQDPEAPFPDRTMSTLYLQKGRGYPECVKKIFFQRGTFVDTPDMFIPEQEQDNIHSLAALIGGNVIT